MREILEDIEAHHDAGIGRAQKPEKMVLRERFYKNVSVAPSEVGFEIHLDGRPTKTPGMKKVNVPTQALAEKLVGEWEAQEEFIDPRKMPLVRLVNSAVEGGENVAQDLRDEVIKFAGNDLMLFRAESPQELVALQEERWGSALRTIEVHFGILLEPVTGIVNKVQPQESLARLAQELNDVGHMELTALVSMTGLSGSGLLAMALRAELVSPDDVWELAHLDETYNAKHWGADGEAIARLEKRRVEFDAAVVVLRLA